MESNLVNELEQRLQAASRHSMKTSWEFADRELEKAYITCCNPAFPEPLRKCAIRRVNIKRGALLRKKGDYNQAIRMLRAIKFEHEDMTLEHVEMIGELGIAYLRIDDFEQAATIFQKQYALASALVEETKNSGAEELNMLRLAEAQVCNAMALRATTIYHLAVPTLGDWSKIDEIQLHSAISLLQECLTRSSSLLEGLEERGSDFWNATIACHSTALGRLTLCCVALGDIEYAVTYGEHSVSFSKLQPDPSVRALSRLYNGFALGYKKHFKEALTLFQQLGDNDLCTSAIALCKEPSTENVVFLDLLSRHGIRVDGYDEHGYSALDYAIQSRSTPMINAVLEGLWRQLSGYEALEAELHLPKARFLEINSKIFAHIKESVFRRDYQATFQDHFRVVWLGICDDPFVVPSGRDFFAKRMMLLRRLYAVERQVVTNNWKYIDGLRFISFLDFTTNFSKLPRPDNLSDMEEVVSLRQDCKSFLDPSKEATGDGEYIIFMSYRWLGNGSPDDLLNTQYGRMKDALRLFLEQNPWLNPDHLAIWLVSVFIWPRLELY